MSTPFVVKAKLVVVGAGQRLIAANNYAGRLNAIQIEQLCNWTGVSYKYQN